MTTSVISAIPILRCRTDRDYRTTGLCMVFLSGIVCILFARGFRRMMSAFESLETRVWTVSLPCFSAFWLKCICSDTIKFERNLP